MIGSARRLLPLLIALAIVLAAALWRADLPGALLRPSTPSPLAGQPPPVSVPSDCARDPVGLAPPTGPEGRPANYLHTCGNQIYDSTGRKVKIAGLNWAGMESGTYAPHGLNNRNWRELLDEIAALGYNTVRLPFGSEALEPGRQVSGIDFGRNPELQGLSGLEMLDLLIAGARERGLKVILDRHSMTPGWIPTLWYSQAVPESRWIADWRMLAARYYGNDTVIAADLSNEPHGEATWGTDDLATDWRLAAERAGNAVLEANPYLLIFVEGVESYRGNRFWWGGNLLGVRNQPVRLRVPNRLVYSPHDYGPAISEQTWFWDSSFPTNLPAEWDRHWGYIHKEAIAPIVVGEFGGRSVGEDKDGQWQRALIDYIVRNDMGSLVWALNPGWDTGGILGDDWQTVQQDRQNAYKRLLAPPLDVGALGVFGQAPKRYRVFVRQAQTDDPATVAFTFRISNDASDSLNLDRLEVRYWFAAGDRTVAPERVDVNTGDVGGAPATIEAVPAQRGDQDHYLSIRFSPTSGAIKPYLMSGRVGVRFHKDGETSAPPPSDFSAAPPESGERFREWDRVALYLDGQRVWGREP